MNAAKFPVHRDLAGFDFAVSPVDQPLVRELATLSFTDTAQNAVLIGGPGTGKTHLATAMAVCGIGLQGNATIGRALRLTMRNLGGAKPDGMEKSTLAWPGKISMCFAENESRSPWEPLRVDRGYSADVTTVSVVAARGIYPMTEGVQETGTGVLETIVAAMRMIGAPIYYQMGVPVVVCLGPEHAAEIARAGYSKHDVRNYLFEHCRMPVRMLRGRGYYAPGCWPAALNEHDDDALVPMVSTPDHFWVVVAGGDGRHSAWMPAWNVCEGATEVVTLVSQS